jgi:head-tail adaptor
MSFSSLLINSCNAYSVATTLNSINEEVDSLALVASAIPCRINRKSGKEEIFADNKAVRIDAVIYMDYRADFDEWDVILIDNTYYNIASKPVIFNSTASHHLEIDVYIDKRF